MIARILQGGLDGDHEPFRPYCPDKYCHPDSRAAANDHHDYWIGINDILVEGQWMWPGLCSRKMAPSFNLTYPWCPGEPNNEGGNRGADCVRVVGTMPATGDHAHPQQCWADYQCDESAGDHGAGNDFGFACELNLDKFGDEDAFAELYGSSDDDDDMLWRDEDRDESDEESGNPAAVAFAVIFALAFVASAFGNVVLLRRMGYLGGAHAAPVVRTMPTSNYQAPLRDPGTISSQPV